MANICTFTAQNNGFAGTIRTLTLQRQGQVRSQRQGGENAPDFRIQSASNYDIGAAWKKVS